MRKKPKLPDYDDGRTIAPMNVDGMPWFVNETDTPPASSENGEQEPLQLTKRETGLLVGGVLLAVLVVGGIFLLGYFLFILFCTNVWFA